MGCLICYCVETQGKLNDFTPEKKVIVILVPKIEVLISNYDPTRQVFSLSDWYKTQLLWDSIFRLLCKYYIITKFWEICAVYFYHFLVANKKDGAEYLLLVMYFIKSLQMICRVCLNIMMCNKWFTIIKMVPVTDPVLATRKWHVDAMNTLHIVCLSSLCCKNRTITVVYKFCFSLLLQFLW